MALKKGSFTFRTAALLAKVLMEEHRAREAVAVFEDEIGIDRVRSNSGMLIQYMRCLRSSGRGREADSLGKDLERVSGEHGTYEMFEAAANLRSRRFPQALIWVDRAKNRQRADRVNLSMLEAAIRIESGDLTNLDEAINFANGVGRSDDALNFRARAALLRTGGWREAETHLKRIRKPNFYDKQLMVKALTAKLEDESTKADPTLRRSVQAELDKAVLDARDTPDVFDR
jgi:hypothetical protein